MERSGHDASGLNEAIIVLRHVYGALLSHPVGHADSRLLTKSKSDCLQSLKKHETDFSLLAAAWLDIPCQYSWTSTAEQDAIRQCHRETLDAFFDTWERPTIGLSFSCILGGDQADKHVWDNECLHLFWGAGLVHSHDDLWYSRLVEDSSEEHTSLSLVK
jgi:hypothetical protein